MFNRIRIEFDARRTTACRWLLVFLAWGWAAFAAAENIPPGRPVPGVGPGSVGRSVTEDEDLVFIEDMIVSRHEEVDPQANTAGTFKAWRSGEVTMTSGPVVVDVDVSNVEVLHLMAKALGGNGGAHAVWGEPVLVDAAGRETRLGELRLIRPRVGSSSLAKDVFDGQGLRFGDRKLSHGIFAHADSSFSVILARKFVRLKATAGINATGYPGTKVIFLVDNNIHTNWESDLGHVHREFFDRWQADLGKNWKAWFLGRDSKADQEIIETMIRQLGRGHGQAKAALARLIDEHAPWTDQRWLRLSLACSRDLARIAALNEVAEGVEKAAVLLKRVKPDLDFGPETVRAQNLARTVDLSDALAIDKAFEELRRLRRCILFAHPALAFDQLLVNVDCPPQLAHNVDQYLGRNSKTSPGLVVLKGWKSDKLEEIWLTRDRLSPGSIRHPDLSYDAKRVLFAYCDHRVERPEHRRFQVYEMAVDGSQAPRKVTGSDRDALEREDDRYTALIEDFDPTYLPDGGFVFASTRGQGFGRCHGGRYAPSFSLYRGELDGSGIRKVTYGEANEITPAVLNDGRIVYNRWDYINRHNCNFHKLWVIYPNGTANANYWGNLTDRPLSVAEPRAIPGTHKIIATATAHHSFTAGSILLVDTARGDEGERPLIHLTPEVSYPECQGWPATTYATPCALTEDLFFAAYSSKPHVPQWQLQRDDAYSIQLVYCVDGKAYREPIFSVPGFSCWSPTPMVARVKPPILPSRLESSADPVGTFTVQNVYESTQPIEKGLIKWLRVNEIINQPSASCTDRGVVIQEITKRVLGIVPVDPDGWVAFHAPAGKKLQFQVLDEDKMAVMTMRTFVYSQPGERQTCIGCHESRRNTPSAGYTAGKPGHAAVRELVAPAGPAVADGFSYVAQVQPVLDRYCIGCHGLDGKVDGGVNLLGSYRPGPERFSESYVAMVKRPGFVKILQCNEEPAFSTPREAFAFRSKLPALLKKHYDVKLSADEWERVISWLDVNCQFYGNYSFNRPENREPLPDGEKALRAAVARRFGDRLAAQPFAALVNNKVASESRLLKAPLAASAGGWGQIKGGWDSLADAAYQEMLKLVEASLAPLSVEDRAGTCNRGEGKCVCGSCWVKKVEEQADRQGGRSQTGSHR